MNPPLANSSNLFVAAVNFDTEATAVYVINENENLIQMINQAGSSTWTCTGLGMPNPSGLGSGVGACANPYGAGFYVYVVDNAGCLHYYFEGSWSAEVVIPSGVTQTLTFGVVNTVSYVTVLVLGTDGNVWASSDTQGNRSWACQAKPADRNAKPVSIQDSIGVSASGSTITCAVLGEDGAVYVLNIDSSASPVGTWSLVGVPPSGEIWDTFGVAFASSISGSRNAPVVTVMDASQVIWQCDSLGAWSSVPPSTQFQPSMAVGSPVHDDTVTAVYVLSPDSTLWAYVFGVWQSLGSPGVQLVQGLAVSGFDTIWVYACDVNGAIWCNTSDNGGTTASWLKIA